MFSERCRSFAIRQYAAKEFIAIVAVLHHPTSTASDVVIAMMMKAWIVPRVSLKSDNAFCCVVAAGRDLLIKPGLRAQYLC